MIVQKIIIVAVEFLPDTPIDVIDIASVISLGWLFAQPQWIALRTHPNKTESYRTDVTNMHPGLCKTGKKKRPTARDATHWYGHIATIHTVSFSLSSSSLGFLLQLRYR